MSDASTIIFHHPRPIGENLSTGSRVRPVQMLKAFEALQYKVELIDGYSKERRAKMQALQSSIERGKRYAFCYAENAPSPYALTDPDHCPRAPFLDREFFQLMQKHQVSTGVFYRDIFWQFPVFKREHSLPIRLLSRPFFHYDLRTLSRGNIRALFMPSERMAAHFPANYRRPPIVPLPPGAQLREHAATNRPLRKQAVYIGGLLPPVYTLHPMFALMQQLPDWRLTVICREEERRQTDQLYPWTQCPNVQCVHASGEPAQEMLSQADIFLWLHAPDAYLDFAMPVKIFEAMGNGLPILTNTRDSVGELIEREGLGWVEEDIGACAKLLNTLGEASYQTMRSHVLDQRMDHSWRRRAELVVETLMTDW